MMTSPTSSTAPPPVLYIARPIRNALMLLAPTAMAQTPLPTRMSEMDSAPARGAPMVSISSPAMKGDTVPTTQTMEIRDAHCVLFISRSCFSVLFSGLMRDDPILLPPILSNESLVLDVGD
ncbi:hypothetical protein GGI19_006709, partial [Coemansia pectinata]